jgi:transposase-like protein
MEPAARPQTLLDAIRYFSDLDVCTEFVARLRWPHGPVCPRCGCSEHSYLTTRRVWKCKGCKKQYSVKLGTIFEDSPLGLDKWLPALVLSANSRHAISSHELARLLGVTQKSAWFMLQRIRLAMQTDSFLLSGDAPVAQAPSAGEGRDTRRTVRARKVAGPRSLEALPGRSLSPGRAAAPARRPGRVTSR